MLDAELFQKDPRNFALQLVEEGLVRAEDMLHACLIYMSKDDVRDMLDSNELSPRFYQDEDECDLIEDVA